MRFCARVMILVVPLVSGVAGVVSAAALTAIAMESVDTVKLSNRIKQSWVGAHSVLLPPWKVER